MERVDEKVASFTITPPQIGDELEIGPMHVRAWKESYVRPELGLTETSIDEMVGHMATDFSYRRNTLTDALANPEKILYRVVRNNEGQIVGFLHGKKHETYTMLEALYLLDEAKGEGLGDTLMQEFLKWADKALPCKLEVFSFNEKAIRFYTKYGFTRNDTKEQLYKDKVPFIEMERLTELRSQ